jgi:hypothetical protein
LACLACIACLAYFACFDGDAGVRGYAGGLQYAESRFEKTDAQRQPAAGLPRF